MLKILHRKMLRPLSETEKKDSSFIGKVSNAIDYEWEALVPM